MSSTTTTVNASAMPSNICSAFSAPRAMLGSSAPPATLLISSLTSSIRKRLTLSWTRHAARPASLFLPTSTSSKANVDEDGRSNLTPDEKGRLAQNFKGYDISPDMVRLSLVNMYLHGFTDPHIYEYDTLTSEDRWNEFADVILANPPFMSPKGGIKPHKRFSIQAKRSEVLFVDYMAEHLTPTGRAGIIVPEGIIFQSQTAYKDLRKMLVENSLVAVVSLPAGVFNPYSGVKTSILIIDKSVAKKTDTILFIKVESEGTDLATRRRATQVNDLPQARVELKTYLQRIRSRQPTETLQLALGLIVPKSKIAANGDYNLSGDRYREDIANLSTFPLVKIGEIFEIAGKDKVGDRALPIMSITMKDGLIDQSQKFKKRIASEDISQYKLVLKDDLVVGFPIDEGVLGFLTQYDAGAVSPAYGVWSIRPEKRDVVEVDYLEIVLRSPRAIAAYKSKMQGAVSRRRSVPSQIFVEIPLPLPPPDVQKEIVAEIKDYQKVINGARAVLDNYRPHIPIHPDWPVLKLGQVIEGKPKNGYSGSPVDYPTTLRVLSLSATTSGKMDLSKFKFLDEDIPIDSPCRCRRGDIYLQRGNTKELVGTAAIFDVDDENYIYPDLMIRIRADETKVRSHYLLTVLKSASAREYMMRNAVGAAGSMPKINQTIVESIPIPLAPLQMQEAIVAEIQAEQALVAANRELVTRFEQKIQATLSRIWGEEEVAATEP